MAESSDFDMKRLARLEGDVRDVKGAVVQIAKLLVDQSERTDLGFREVHSELRDVRTEIQSTREALVERLDRLVEISMRERTMGIERLAEIERRLAKLEAQAGI